jgi:hypothetical protein
VVVLPVVFVGLAGEFLAGLVVLFAVGFGGDEVDVSGVVVHFGRPLVVLVAGSVVFSVRHILGFLGSPVFCGLGLHSGT